MASCFLSERFYFSLVWLGIKLYLSRLNIDLFDGLLLTVTTVYVYLTGFLSTKLEFFCYTEEQLWPSC